MPQQHTLRAGDLELVLDAARGGSIMAFRERGFDLFRPWDGVSEDPRSFASFPLVPYSGRIDQGRFRFEGHTYQEAPNFPPEPHAIHGHGWTSAWDLVTAQATAAEMELLHDPPPHDDAAFRYRAWQHFWLYPDRLEIEIGVTNRGGRPMPFGLGHHPYFGHRDEALLSAEVSGVWMPDDANIPRRLEPVPVLWGFRLRRPVAELVLDHVFQGWDGTARIDWPDAGRSLVMEADPLFQNLVVYVPPGRDFFCVEPVSHVGDGFNLMERGVPDTGVRVLAPGATLRGSVRFRPGPTAGL
jgi:aldose 1-epimerase